MSLAAGTRLGPYEITAPLGAGGMGEVYRATDTRLGCDIPIILMAGAMTADEALAPIEGVAVVLIKPFPLATMLDAVRRVLRASKRR
jgi:DNA-binding NtrC family response regulator